MIVLLGLCVVLAASGYPDGKRRYPDRCIDPAHPQLLLQMKIVSNNCTAAPTLSAKSIR